jgi:heat shock 70kDa protein 4
MEFPLTVLFSSLVSFGIKQRSIGEAAKTQETSNFKNTVGSLKRLIGRTSTDPEVLEVEKKFIPATLVDANGTVAVKVGVTYLSRVRSPDFDFR